MRQHRGLKSLRITPLRDRAAEDEDVRRTLMEQFEAELIGVITRGLAGKAPR
jgi:hypothetical protein